MEIKISDFLTLETVNVFDKWTYAKTFWMRLNRYLFQNDCLHSMIKMQINKFGTCLWPTGSAPKSAQNNCRPIWQFEWVCVFVWMFFTVAHFVCIFWYYIDLLLNAEKRKLDASMAMRMDCERMNKKKSIPPDLYTEPLSAWHNYFIQTFALNKVITNKKSHRNEQTNEKKSQSAINNDNSIAYYPIVCSKNTKFVSSKRSKRDETKNVTELIVFVIGNFKSEKEKVGFVAKRSEEKAIEHGRR